MMENHRHGEHSLRTSPPPLQVRWGRWGNRPSTNTPTTTRLGGVGVWWGSEKPENPGGEKFEIVLGRRLKIQAGCRSVIGGAS